jgi:hypothetical protein
LQFVVVVVEVDVDDIFADHSEASPTYRTPLASPSSSTDAAFLRFLRAKHPVVERALAQNLKQNIHFDYSVSSIRDAK